MRQRITVYPVRYVQVSGKVAPRGFVAVLFNLFVWLVSFFVYFGNNVIKFVSNLTTQKEKLPPFLLLLFTSLDFCIRRNTLGINRHSFACTD